MSASIITRIQVRGDYDIWRPMLVESGVLDRFEDKHGPNVVQDTGE